MLHCSLIEPTPTGLIVVPPIPFEVAPVIGLRSWKTSLLPIRCWLAPVSKIQQSNRLCPVVDGHCCRPSAWKAWLCCCFRSVISGASCSQLPLFPWKVISLPSVLCLLVSFSLSTSHAGFASGCFVQHMPECSFEQCSQGFLFPPLGPPFTAV